MMTSPTSPEPTSTISTFASTPVELTAVIVSPIPYKEPPVETDAPVIIVCTVPVIDTSGSELSTPVMVPPLTKDPSIVSTFNNNWYIVSSPSCSSTTDSTVADAAAAPIVGSTD